MNYCTIPNSLRLITSLVSTQYFNEFIQTQLRNNKHNHCCRSCRIWIILTRTEYLRNDVFKYTIELLCSVNDSVVR